MLRTNCPKCEAVITSPLLADLQLIDCPQCKENVKVGDVFVLSKGFTMHRNDLLNRISSYKKLLKEVEDEVQSMEKNGTVSKTTERSVKGFRAILRELMLGARDNFRLDVPYDLYVEMEHKNKKRLVKLINISVQGALVELVEQNQPLRKGSEVNLQLLLPGLTDTLSLEAKVVWIIDLSSKAKSPRVTLGVQFKNLDKKTQSRVWGFIVETTAASGPLYRIMSAGTSVSDD